MGVLNRQAIEEYLLNGQLIDNPRSKGKEGPPHDIENASYDLSAGTAIWKTPSRDRYGSNIKTRSYSTELNGSMQPTVTVQPGQMIFVVTRENISMPRNLCGTVYSRNSLALNGILALNAGHVDPGYKGPIAIRLINLRATPWTLTLGAAIFAIAFQTVNPNPRDTDYRGRKETQETVIARVRGTADAALSNALYDLYQADIEKRLIEFKSEALDEFSKAGGIKRDEIWSVLLDAWWKKILAGLLYVAAVSAPVAAVLVYLLERS